MYQAWLYYGEFLVLGSFGLLLTLVRRILFGKLCKNAVLGNAAQTKMLKQMTLKFEKSYEVKVGIFDREAFVDKYLYQEKRFGISLARWRHLPERFVFFIIGIGFLEAMILHYLKYENSFCIDRFLAAVMSAVLVHMAVLWFESDSFWKQAKVCLLDYVSNTLYPRQIHVYESFEEEKIKTKPEAKSQIKSETKKVRTKASERPKKELAKAAKKRLNLEKEEEQILTEVIADFLGSST